MPSAITHQLIANAAVSRLPNTYAPMPALAPDYYFLGSQGGDPLFFYKPLSRREQNFGKHVHRRGVYELFCAMQEHLLSLSGEPLEKARAYCLGYISHYSADVCFHPFVYNLLSERSNTLAHAQIENDWDVYFARTRAKSEVEHYNFPFDAEKMADEDILYPLVNRVAVALGRREIGESALARALKNYERYLKFFHGACYKHARRLQKLGLKGPAKFYPRETPESTLIESDDFFSLANGKGGNADELFDKAADDSARRMILFLAALDGAPLPREEFCYHLLTGERL